MWRTGKGEKEEECTQRKQEKGKSGRKVGEVVWRGSGETKAAGMEGETTGKCCGGYTCGCAIFAKRGPSSIGGDVLAVGSTNRQSASWRRNGGTTRCWGEVEMAGDVAELAKKGAGRGKEVCWSVGRLEERVGRGMADGGMMAWGRGRAERRRGCGLKARGEVPRRRQKSSGTDPSERDGLGWRRDRSGPMRTTHTCKTRRRRRTGKKGGRHTGGARRRRLGRARRLARSYATRSRRRKEPGHQGGGCRDTIKVANTKEMVRARDGRWREARKGTMGRSDVQSGRYKEQGGGGGRART